MKRNLFLMAAASLLTIFVGCSSEDDATNPSPFDPTQTVTKVSIIDPIGYAQNLGAWIPADATNKYNKLLVEEGQHYILGVICQPSSVKNPNIDWNFINTQFEEANISEQGVITGVTEDPNNTNQCLIVATAPNNISDTIEVCVLKEISGVYEIQNADRELTFIDGGSKRSTSRVTKASNASGALQNKDLITAFFSDKNRANFNDAVTISFVSGTSFDIQGNGVGVNILMAYSKAYLSTTAGTAYFDNVRDYTVMTSTSRRQMNMVDSSYVSLDKHNQHVNSGETFNLTGKLTAMSPRKMVPVQFASSNPAIATVDANGKVTAVSRGIATITAYTNHLAESQYCVVNVDNANPVAVTRIVDVTDFTTAHTVSRALLVKGQKKQLYADPHKDEMTAASGTEWRSSDPSIVSVDANGMVTAVATGTAIIYNTPFMVSNGVKEYGIPDCSCITVMPDYTTAQLGDIFYEDGSFSSTLILGGKKPIGIIAYLNCDANGTVAAGTNELCESMETNQYGAFDAAKNYHGLVISLEDANTSTEEVIWGKKAEPAATSTVAKAAGVTIANGDATNSPIAGIASNMSAYSAAVSTNIEDIVDGTRPFEPSEYYPASYKAWNYNVNVPSFCTGWFLPSAPQWYAVLTKGLGGLGATTIIWQSQFDTTNAAFGNINAKLGAIGADPLTDGIFWTINESSNTGDKATVLVKDASGLTFTDQTKTETVGGAHKIVRPFFAF